MKLKFSLVMLIWIAVAVGCSGTNPVQPVDKPVNVSQQPNTGSERQLWGMWDIGIDLETMTATVMPDRDAESHFNVLPFLLPPKCSDCLKLHVNSFDTVTRILDVDVTLHNKFAVAGYDVRGILFTDDLGHLLKNWDAWTPLYDIPGGDTINPYIAFSKNDPQWKFPGLTELTENYRIWVPDPPKYLTIKYAVDASYPNNCTEPYAIGNFSQDKITSHVGSHGIVSIAVSDWQDDVNAVVLAASAITGVSTTPLIHQSGNIWSVDLPNNQGAAAGDYKVKIKATSTGSGTTGLYYFVTITISEPSGWARTWGGSDTDEGYSVAVDGSGDAYVFSWYFGTTDFDPGTGFDNHTSNGKSDVCLSKFDESGNFLWARAWGSSEKEYSSGVALDGSGNVYVTGGFEGTGDFDPGSGVDSHTPNGVGDVFLSKFDQSGNFIWAITFGGADDDWANGLAVDGSGNACVTGVFQGTVDFDPGSEVHNHTSSGGADVFLAKYDSSGGFRWARAWGANDTDEGWGVTVDGSGNPYVTGFFTGAVDFDPGSGTDSHISNGSIDIFLSKFNQTGNFQWACTFGGTDVDEGNGVAVDGSGNVYVTGMFQSTVDFDPASAGTDNHISNGDYDAFLSKFDPSGSFLWARTWGDSITDQGFSVAVDASGNALVAGYFTGTVDFDPASAGTDSHTSNGAFDISLSKFDPSGSFQWARTFGGSDFDQGIGVAVDGSGNAYVTGWFAGTADFDPSAAGIDSHTSNGKDDAFVSKFDTNGNW